jgi:hypothetical protein
VGMVRWPVKVKQAAACRNDRLAARVECSSSVVTTTEMGGPWQRAGSGIEVLFSGRV